MQYKRIEEGYLVRLEPGEEILARLTEVITREKIPGGFVFGMGAVEHVTIGFYDFLHKCYITKTFRDRLEVGNLIGNICYTEDTDEPFVHCHVTVGDSSLNAYTGHLFEAVVLVMAELFIKPTREKMLRAKKTEAGANHWLL